MSNLMEYAKSELDGIGMKEGSTDEMNGAMRAHILKMMEMFADEGHSGFSASYAAMILERLMRFEPLKPLTGEDSEWNEVGDQDGPLYQNRRCSRVFKDNEGAYDIQGKVFKEPNGSCYTSRDSRVFIEFPYVPKTEYVDVPFESPNTIP